MVGVRWEGAAAYCNWLSAVQGYQPCYNLTTWAMRLHQERLPPADRGRMGIRRQRRCHLRHVPLGRLSEYRRDLVQLAELGRSVRDGRLSVDHARGLLQRRTATEERVQLARQPDQLPDLQRRQRLRPVRHGGQRLAVDQRLVRPTTTTPSARRAIPPGRPPATPCPTAMPYHVLRGGNWYNGAEYYGHARIANRDPAYYRGPEDPESPVLPRRVPRGSEDSDASSSRGPPTRRW